MMSRQGNGNFFFFLGLSLLILLFNSYNSISQVRQLTIDEAIDIGMKNSHEIQASKLGYQKAKAAVNEAYGYAMPSLNLSANYTNNIESPVFFLPSKVFNPNDSSGGFIPMSVGAKNTFNTVASISQVLFNSSVFTGIGATGIYLQVSQEAYKSTVTKTITNIKKVFNGVLISREYVNVIKSSLQNSEKNLEIVRAMYGEGFIPEFDKIRAEVAVNLIKPQVSQAETGYINALNALKVAMGIQIKDSIEISGDISLMDMKTDYNNDNFSNIESVNYDLRSMEKLIEVNRAMVNLKRSEYYPILNLFGNYIYSGQGNTLDNVNTAKSASVGINFSINLFQGFQTNARVEQAQIDVQTSEEKYRQTSEAIKMQLNNLQLQMKIAVERMETQRSTVEMAQRGFQIAQIRYKEGQGSQLEINDADNVLLQSRLALLQAQNDYMQSKYDLEALIGLIPEKYFEIKN